MKYAVAVSGCVIFAVISISLFSKSSNQKHVISYDTLSSDYSIIGPLGTELGKVMQLEVEKIKSNMKSDPGMLRIISIEGKKLEKPVSCKYRMLIIDDKFDYNKILKIKAFQDGCFTGTPREVLNDLMFQTADYRFEVELVVFKYID